MIGDVDYDDAILEREYERKNKRLKVACACLFVFGREKKNINIRAKECTYLSMEVVGRQIGSIHQPASH